MAGGADPAVSERAWLAAVCASELGTLLVFSNFSALLPLLQREWDLSNSQAGLIVSFYQFGYIGAVMILATLTDYMPPRRIYVASAFWTASRIPSAVIRPPWSWTASSRMLRAPRASPSERRAMRGKASGSAETFLAPSPRGTS